MTWTQNFTPITDNLVLSSLAALIPILYFFWALTIKRMKGYIAGITTLLVALAVAVLIYGMPAGKAVMSASQGARIWAAPNRMDNHHFRIFVQNDC